MIKIDIHILFGFQLKPNENFLTLNWITDLNWFNFK
jgi:hypothetical protein